MAYSIFKPSPQLRPYVESIWVQESHAPVATSVRPTRVLPNGSMEIAFYYFDRFVEVGGEKNLTLPRSTITGQKTRFKDYSATGRTGVIVARLFPWAPRSLLRLPLDDITDQNVSLKTILRPKAVAETEERLAEARSPQERSLVVDAFLRSLIDDRYHDPLIKDAIFQMKKNVQVISITGLARQFQISTRQFERRFKRQVGLGPKQFSRIMRFQNSALYRRLGRPWPEVIDFCGYYDQSHYIKEFKFLSGLAPDTLISRPETSLAKHFNRDDSSQFYNTIYL